MGQQNFGPQHLIYLGVSFALTILFWIICIRNIKTKEAQQRFLKIGAGVLILMLIVNRSLIHYYLARPFLPQSWCAVTGMMFALCLLFGKKDGYFIQYFAPVGILSGLIPTFVGDYLNEGYTFGWDTILFPPTFTSLIYHSFMFFLGILCVVFKYVTFDYRKWFMIPICYGIEIAYGLIYLHFYPDGYTDAIGKTLNVMNINKPALANTPFNAWGIFAIVIVLEIIIYPILWYVQTKVLPKKRAQKKEQLQ